MIEIDGHEITRIEMPDKNGIFRAISYIQYGAKLVWQSVRSCFGSGAWVNEKPWLNEEGWK